MFASSEQHFETELEDCRASLATALGQRDELLVSLKDFSRKLNHWKRELEMKDEALGNLQMDMKKLIHEWNNQGTEMAKLVAKHKRDLKEYSESNDNETKKALPNQEQFTKSVCDQNNQLQENISALEEEQISVSNKIKVLEKKNMEANTQCNLLIKERSALNDKIEKLEEAINEKIKLLNHSEIRNQDLRVQIATLESQYSEKCIELEALAQESNLKSEKILELHLNNHDLDSKIATMQNALENFKLENKFKVDEFNAALKSKEKIIESKDKELESKASTINQLMSDLKNMADAKIKLENHLENAKKELERNNAKDKEKSLAKKIELETVARDKEIPTITPKDSPKQDSLQIDFFSDSSTDNELTIDTEEVNRRFEAMSRGEFISSPLLFRRGKGPLVTIGGLKPNNNGNRAQKNKRTFFKIKEPEKKVKKFKSVD